MDFEDIPQSNDEEVEFSQPQSSTGNDFYEDDNTDNQTKNFDSFPEPEAEPAQSYSAFPDPSEPEDALA